jgi:hypothetical protein
VASSDGLYLTVFCDKVLSAMIIVMFGSEVSTIDMSSGKRGEYFLIKFPLLGARIVFGVRWCSRFLHFWI